MITSVEVFQLANGEEWGVGVNGTGGLRRMLCKSGFEEYAELIAELIRDHVTELPRTPFVSPIIRGSTDYE